jgi:GTP:adenosylcobinamide-phosphate guanylyltransferase
MVIRTSADLRLGKLSASRRSAISEVRPVQLVDRAAAPVWTAILLAGERPGVDPLAAHFGAASKAGIELAGISMLRRVASTLLQAPEIGRIVILAQDAEIVFAGDAADLRRNPRVTFEPSGAGIATSIAKVLDSGTIGWPVLVTTADHALLTTAMITEFLAGAQDCDLAVGFGERKAAEARYPETRRTWLKFADGHFSGANLFALRNARVQPALSLWSEIEQDRKKGWKMLSRFGPMLLLRALTRTIALPDALARAGLGLRLFARAVVMQDPEAAIDVDKIGDHQLAERILRTRESAAGGLTPLGRYADKRRSKTTRQD